MRILSEYRCEARIVGGQIVFWPQLESVEKIISIIRNIAKHQPSVNNCFCRHVDKVKSSYMYVYISH